MKVRTMRGREVDMAAIIAQNEETLAVGTVGEKMNARGDILGPGGRIIKTRQEIAQEYHRNNPKAVRNVPLKDLAGETLNSDNLNMNFADPAAAWADSDPQAKRKKRKIVDKDD